MGRAIDPALGDAATVVNVGAGTGNYEPSRDRRGRRAVRDHGRAATTGAAPAVRGVAEALPVRVRRPSTPRSRS